MRKRALESFDIAAPVMPLLLKDVVIHGVTTGNRRALEDFVKAVDRTRLKPHIDTIYSIEALLTALDHLDYGAFGKIVISTEGLSKSDGLVPAVARHNADK